MEQQVCYLRTINFETNNQLTFKKLEVDMNYVYRFVSFYYIFKMWFKCFYLHQKLLIEKLYACVQQLFVGVPLCNSIFHYPPLQFKNKWLFRTKSPIISPKSSIISPKPLFYIEAVLPQSNQIVVRAKPSQKRALSWPQNLQSIHFPTIFNISSLPNS